MIENNRIIVASSSLMSMCNTHSECVALQDPYCSWYKDIHKCQLTTQDKESIQNVSEGVHSDCGKPEKKTKAPSRSASVDNWDTTGTPPPDHVHSSQGIYIVIGSVVI